jgi:catechol 2,3-dioxygenase-like lactoylglutathione lyase family enzyme
MSDTLSARASASDAPAAVRPAGLEHVNITVADPARTARLLVNLFGWRIRWEGPSALGGYTFHVGSETAYLAVYGRTRTDSPPLAHAKGAPLNHIGIEVGDLDAAEARILAAGFKTFSHGDYEPGRRFYFFDENGIEFEIVSYAQ